MQPSLSADWQPNPFSTCFVRPGAIPFLFPAGDRAHSERLRELAQRVTSDCQSLIVGPHGTGKTTLLHSLRPILSEHYSDIQSVLLHTASTCSFGSRWRNQRDQHSVVRRHQSMLADEGLLIIDGIEQLSQTAIRRILWRSRRRKQHLLATSHRPIRHLNTIYHSHVDAGVLQSLIHSLMQNSHQERTRIVQSVLSRRSLSKVTNVRELLFDLYDAVADHSSGFQPQ